MTVLWVLVRFVLQSAWRWRLGAEPCRNYITCYMQLLVIVITCRNTALRKYCIMFINFTHTRARAHTHNVHTHTQRTHTHNVHTHTPRAKLTARTTLAGLLLQFLPGHRLLWFFRVSPNAFRQISKQCPKLSPNNLLPRPFFSQSITFRSS
jgi:hypothetical protein